MNKERILLTEYEMCQQDNIASSHQYYQIVGIFMAVITAVLGGLIYGVISSDVLLNLFRSELLQVLALGLPIILLGIGVIAILVFLWFWLKRVNYLADRNYERMREIELELGMWKSWRIHIIDQWNKIRQKLSFKKYEKPSDEVIEIWEKVLEGVGKELSEEYWERLAERQGELFEMCDHYESQHWYERPSRNRSYKWILCTLIGLWVVVIMTAMAAIVRAVAC